MTAIRPEQPTDLPAIRRVNEQAFGRPNEAHLVDLLRANGRAAISLVATLGDEIVGHVMFSPISFDPPWPGVRALGLAPVAVLPTCQGWGIGSGLIRAGLAACREAGCELVVVLGDPAFYSRFGFARASGRGLDNEYGVDEPFMMLELTAGPADGARRLVKYAEEFSVVGD